MEYWNIGVLEYWSIGVLEFWSIGILEYWNFGVLEFWSTGILDYWNIGVLEYCPKDSFGGVCLKIKILPFRFSSCNDKKVISVTSVD